MATSLEEGCLKNVDMSEVAYGLPPPPGNITFARGYLHLEKEQVDSLVTLHGENRAKLNQSFIQAWMEQNPDQDQKKVFIKLEALT